MITRNAFVSSCTAYVSRRKHQIPSAYLVTDACYSVASNDGASRAFTRVILTEGSIRFNVTYERQVVQIELPFPHPLSIISFTMTERSNISCALFPDNAYCFSLFRHYAITRRMKRIVLLCSRYKINPVAGLRRIMDVFIVLFQVCTTDQTFRIAFLILLVMYLLIMLLLIWILRVLVIIFFI